MDMKQYGRRVVEWWRNGNFKCIVHRCDKDTLEEKVFFPFSRQFWQKIVLAGVAAIAVGIVVLLWNFLPVLERSVDEPQLSKDKEIAAEDVRPCYAHRLVKTKEAKREKGGVAADVATEEKKAPILNFDELKEAVPDVSWKPIYEQDYWYGTTRLIDAGFEKKMSNLLQERFPFDSLRQQKVVDLFVPHVVAYSKRERASVLKNSFKWYAEEEGELWPLWSEIDSVLTNKTEKAGVIFAEVADFAVKNKVNGATAIRKMLKLVVLDAVHGVEIVREARKGITTLDLDYEWWNAATDRFMTLTSLHDRVDMSLPCYYAKVKEEHDEVAAKNEMELERYRFAKNSAEYEAEEKRGKQKEWRVVAVAIIGGGIVAVAFFSLMLVLLSMQRTLMRMETALRKSDGGN